MISGRSQISVVSHETGNLIIATMVATEVATEVATKVATKIATKVFARNLRWSISSAIVKSRRNSTSFDLMISGSSQISAVPHETGNLIIATEVATKVATKITTKIATKVFARNLR